MCFSLVDQFADESISQLFYSSSDVVEPEQQQLQQQLQLMRTFLRRSLGEWGMGV